MLPHDLPPKSSVYEYFSAWRDDGTWQRFVDTLREAYRPLAAKSEEPTPSAASIDSQSVKTTECGGVRGYDGGKRITGRKRHLVVDALGLLLAISVTSAAVDDAAAAPRVLAQLTRQAYPRLEVVWADGKYHNHGRSARADACRGGWRLSNGPSRRRGLCSCRSGGWRNARSLGSAALAGRGVPPQPENHLGLKQLRCKKPDMVRKDFAMYLLAYNSIRLLACEAAARKKVRPHEISFKHTLQTTNEFFRRFHQSDFTTWLENLLETAPEVQVANRPNRIEPYTCKTRPQDFPPTNELRSNYKRRTQK